MANDDLPAPLFDAGRVSRTLFDIRGYRVMLDADVAALFGRPTEAINQQRKRNDDRFPEHYAFQLTSGEWTLLRSQTVISSFHGGRRSMPWAYTEHGFAMLTMNMRGEIAAQISRAVIDVFVDYRRGLLPSERVVGGTEAGATRRAIRQGLVRQMEQLSQLQLPTGTSTGEELRSMTEAAIGRVRAVLDRPAKENARIEAEIRKLEAETAKIYAEVQQSEAQAASIWADTYLKRLNILRELREMAAQLERDDVLDTLDTAFGPELPRT